MIRLGYPPRSVKLTLWISLVEAYPEDRFELIRRSEPTENIFIDVFENEAGFQVTSIFNHTIGTRIDLSDRRIDHGTGLQPFLFRL